MLIVNTIQICYIKLLEVNSFKKFNKVVHDTGIF